MQIRISTTVIRRHPAIQSTMLYHLSLISCPSLYGLATRLTCMIDHTRLHTEYKQELTFLPKWTKQPRPHHKMLRSNHKARFRPPVPPPAKRRSERSTIHPTPAAQDPNACPQTSPSQMRCFKLRRQVQIRFLWQAPALQCSVIHLDSQSIREIARKTKLHEATPKPGLECKKACARHQLPLIAKLGPDEGPHPPQLVLGGT